MVSGQRNKKFLGEKMIVLNKPGKNMWQMKLYLVVLFLVIPAVMICPVAANPPSAINLVYNSSSGELAVTITHVVADPADHFIKLVEVHSGGAVLISEQYSSQPATETFTYRYTVPAPGGDLLEVTASCNKFGSLTADDPGAEWIPAGSATIRDSASSAVAYGIDDYRFYLHCYIGLHSRVPEEMEALVQDS